MFTEYIPAENAWIPIEADGYMYIDCLWVSGSFKGHGYSTDLLNDCIEDSKGKGKKGLCILSAEKKKPFLADPKFLKYKGFAVSDEADNGIQLMHLPFDNGAETPKFKECARHPHIEEMGYVLYYTSQCPFNAKYVPVLEQTAKDNNMLLFTPQNRVPAARLLAGKVNSASEGASPKANFNATERYCSRVADP